MRGGKKKNINVHVVRHQTRTHGFSCMCQDKGAAHIAVWCSSRLECKGHDDYLDFMRSSHIHVWFGSALHAGASQGEGRRERTLLQDVRGVCRARPASECPPCPREIKRAARLQCVKPPVPEYLFWSICVSVLLLSCGPLSSGRTQDLICLFFSPSSVFHSLFISSCDFRSELPGVELASKQIGPPRISPHNLPFTDPRNHTVWLLSNQLTVAQTVDGV